MNERQQNIAVGLTTLLGLCGLAFMLLLFGWVPALIRGGYGVTVELPSAAGLHVDGVVTYRGIEVGKVTSVALNPPPASGVTASLIINEDVELPANVVAVLEGSIFGTNAQLALRADEWNGDGPVEFLPTDGSAVIKGSSSSAVETFAQLSQQIGTLSEEWVKVGQNINALLEPRDVAAVDAGDTIGNAATVMARLDQRLAEIEGVLAGIDQYVNDPQLWDDVHATAKNTRALSDKLSNQVPGDITAVRNSVVKVADDLSKTIASLNETLEAARRPDGTLGKLLVDPALYNNMNDTFQRTQQAIDELRLLIEKWKDEGLPIQF